jgi:DNA-binding NarL/FixJ family response regulator
VTSDNTVSFLRRSAAETDAGTPFPESRRVPVILVLDDDVRWRRRVARVLHARAIIRTADTVETARRVLCQAPISAVVVELELDKGSSLPLLEELRGRLPALALSATTNILDVSRASTLGATFASKLEPQPGLLAKLERLAISAACQRQARLGLIERLCASVPLTHAERETLRAYLETGRRDALAGELGIAETSVRSRVRTLCRKLDVEHLADVYRLLFEHATASPH